MTSPPSVAETARRILAQPPTGRHWPTQPLVDGRACDLLERWAFCFALAAAQLSSADEAIAFGKGQADLRTYQRVGYDPTANRLDWGPDDPDQADPDIGLLGPPPRLSDAEKREVAKLVEQAFGRLAYHLAWFERKMRPPEQEAG